MKKLFIFMFLLAGFTGLYTKSKEEKEAYFKSKIEAGAREESAEFRLALKLNEYLCANHTNWEKIIDKISLYLSKRTDNMVEALEFVQHLFTLSHEQLDEYVGTKNKLGLLKRFKNQDMTKEPYAYDLHQLPTTQKNL
jgi:hypothetical protein